MNAWTSEPWPPRQEIGHSISLQDYNRARECVNGCAGLNPSAYRACVEALIKAVQMLEGAYEPKQGMSNDLRAPWDLEMDSVLPELKQALAQAVQP